MQLKSPLTPTLSPSDGEKAKLCWSAVDSQSGDIVTSGLKGSLAPSDGERVRVRGRLDGITAIAKHDSFLKP
jgi:hypothetical protein